MDSKPNPAADPNPHTYRVTARIGDDEVTHEVVAAYYRYEDGLVTFKDNAHAAVLSIAIGAVLRIERLRTHLILAIGAEELRILCSALARETEHYREHGSPAGCQDSETWHRLDALKASLDRLQLSADQREATEPASMPRAVGAP